MEPVTGKLLLKNLQNSGVRVVTATTLKRFDNRTAYIQTSNGEQALGEFDTVVSAVGSMPTNTLEQQLLDHGLDVHSVGDARHPGNIYSAVTDGFNTGRSI